MTEKRDIAMMAAMIAGQLVVLDEGYDANTVANDAVDLALRIQDKVWGAPELIDECICSVEQGQLKHHPQCPAEQHRRTPHDDNT